MVHVVDILLTPPVGAWPAADAIAVVDVFRATTTVTMLLHHGATAVIVVADLSLAREIARLEGAILAGEVGGLPPPGFDLGNSPVGIDPAIVAGRCAVLFTTNGTRALCMAASAGATAAVAAVNATAAVRWLGRAGRVLIVCAGERQGTAFALEDFAVAAHLVQELEHEFPRAKWGDGAQLGLATPHPLNLAARAAHAVELRELGFAADIALGLQRDIVDVVPVVVAQGEGWARLEACRV